MTGATDEASHSLRRIRRRRVRAYVGLGSNLGAAADTLAAAVGALDALPGARVRAVSPLYATAPVGVTDQPEFRNAVVAVDVPGPAGPDAALDLLVALKDLERLFGRVDRQRWGPREVDLDLLVFGRWAGAAERPPAARSADPARRSLPLVVPHPEAQRRLFVLAPLADLAPHLVPPGWGESARTAERRQRGLERPDAVRMLGRWTGRGWAHVRSDRTGSGVSRTPPSRSSTR